MLAIIFSIFSFFYPLNFSVQDSNYLHSFIYTLSLQTPDTTLDRMETFITILFATIGGTVQQGRNNNLITLRLVTK